MKQIVTLIFAFTASSWATAQIAGEFKSSHEETELNELAQQYVKLINETDLKKATELMKVTVVESEWKNDPSRYHNSLKAMRQELGGEVIFHHAEISMRRVALFIIVQDGTRKWINIQMYIESGDNGFRIAKPAFVSKTEAPKKPKWEEDN